MMLYLKVLVITAVIIGTKGQARNSRRENYLRNYANKWWSTYLPDSNLIAIASASQNWTTGCVAALNEFKTSINHPENGLWALSMVDSWGKSNDGFLYGDPYILGAYDQCLRAASPDKSIRGKYCTMAKFNINDQVDGRDTATIKGLGDSLRRTNQFGKSTRIPGIQWRGQTMDQLMKELSPEFSKQWMKQLEHRGIFKGKKYMENPSNEQQSNGSVGMGGIPIYHPSGFLTYGTCVPHLCTQEQIQTGFIDFLHPADVDWDHLPYVFNCDELDEEIVLDGVDISFISFCSVIGLLMLAGTVVHGIILFTKQESLAKGPLRFLLPFAVTMNLKKIFTINSNPAPAVISCLNGMRVMSMCWVIWGHQNLFTLGALANVNGLDRLDSYLYQIVINADLSTDSFFFMSGLLVCYGVMRELNKTGRLNIIMYYVHRIIRLTPPIAMSVFFISTLYRFMVRGPIPLSYSSRPNWMAGYCRDMGWRDIAYVSNIAFRNNETIPQGCLGQCWYTSADTQLYALAPLLLLPLYYLQTIGCAWGYVITIWAVAMRGFITWNGRNIEVGVDNPWMYDNYFPTWVRVDAWMIGIWTGYFIANMGKKKLVLKHWVVVVGWTVAVVFGLMVMFGRYHAPQVGSGHIIYEMIHRTVWASCLAWVTITCHYGYGGVVNEFLSHPSWQPFSRLTYTTYLVAQEFTYLLTNASRTLFYFTHLNKIIETCGILFICNIFALFISLTVEAPILGLEKLLLKRPGRGVEEVAGSKASPSPGPNDHIDTPGPVNPNNYIVAPVNGKGLPPGYMKHAETFGGTGQDNVAFEPSEKESIPLKDMLLKQSTELGPEQQQEAAVGWSVPEGSSDSEPHQGAATTTHVTVELEQHNKKSSS